jgi:hypothetical protein
MRCERGSMLIHVALSMIGLMAFGALAIGYGVMWSARRQAQNAAVGMTSRKERRQQMASSTEWRT